MCDGDCEESVECNVEPRGVYGADLTKEEVLKQPERYGSIVRVGDQHAIRC